MQPQTSPIHTTSVGRWHDVAGLEQKWECLLGRCEAVSVFQTLPWQLCWWRSFGAGHRLYLVLAYSGQRLVAVAPMMVCRDHSITGNERRCMHFIGSVNHASDYCDFIVDPEYPQALDALLAAIADSDCQRFDLSQIPGESPHRKPTVEILRRHGLRVCDDVQQEAPVRILGDAGSDRKAANKTSLKRNRNYFEKKGELAFHRCTEVDDILANLDAFFEQHRVRWAETDWPSLFLERAQRRFYRDIVRQLHPRDWLTFDIVRLDGEPLAFHLGFEFRRRFIWYKPTFDVRHAPKSPGQVLIKYLLETAIDRNLAEFDFTIGSEGFKHRFANKVRRIHRISGFRSITDYWQHRSRCELRKRFGRTAGVSL